MPVHLIAHKDLRKLEAAVNRALSSAPEGTRRVLLGPVTAGANGEFVATVVDEEHVAANPARHQESLAANSLQAAPKPAPGGQPVPDTTRPHTAKSKKPKRGKADGGEG